MAKNAHRPLLISNNLPDLFRSQLRVSNRRSARTVSAFVLSIFIRSRLSISGGLLNLKAIFQHCPALCLSAPQLKP